MKIIKTLTYGLLAAFLAPTVVMAQAFGDYGRTLGGVSQRHGGATPSAPGGLLPGRGNGGSQDLGDVGARPIPSVLVVASKAAALYLRQDDEAEKIAQLTQGETVIPMVQSTGGNEWYMVRTQKGLIGWVKSSDVREPPAKKK